MSNKTFFVLLFTAISPYFVIQAIEKAGVFCGFALFFAIVLLAGSYFKRAKDI